MSARPSAAVVAGILAAGLFAAALPSVQAAAPAANYPNRPIRLITPLMHSSKAEIIQLGHRLGVDYAMTVSCYQATDDGTACGRCDSCRLREAGFRQAGVPDPTRYGA
jgi:7-cyano-7-deazaguanine synthase